MTTAASTLDAAPMGMQEHHSSVLLRSLVIGLTAFLTVVDLFATQAILPTLTRAYGVTPAAMGFAVNSSTLGMAAAGLLVSLFSRRIDRRLGILISLALLSIPTALLAVAPDLTTFTILRVAQGLCMASAFTLTLAYLGEECSAGRRRRLRGLHHRQCREQPRRPLDLGRDRGPSRPRLELLLFAALNLAGAVLVYFTVARAAPMEETGTAAPLRWLHGSSTCAIRNCVPHSGSDSASCSRSSARSHTSTSFWSVRRYRSAQCSSASSISCSCRRS